MDYTHADGGWESVKKVDSLAGVAGKKVGVPKTGAGGQPLAPALDVVTVPVLTQKGIEFSVMECA